MIPKLLSSHQGLLVTKPIHRILSSILPGKVFLIKGRRGVGKSTALRMTCPDLHINPSNWVNATIPYITRSNGMISTPSVSEQILSLLAEKGFTSKQESQLEKIRDILSHNPLRVAIDNINAFYCLTEYYSKTGQEIPSKKLEIVDLFKDLMRQPDKRCSFLLATTATPFKKSKIDLEADGIEFCDLDVFGFKGYDGLDGRLSRQEVEMLCRMKGLSVVKDEFYTLCGGNPGKLVRIIEKELLY